MKTKEDKNSALKKRKKSILSVGFITILLFVMILGLMMYAQMLQEDLRDEVRNKLKEVSNQNVLIIQKEIEGDRNALIEIAERIGESGLSEEWEIVDTLRSIAPRYSFSRMGFYKPDGLAYTTDGVVMNISERDYFKEAMIGNFSLSELLIEMVNGEEVIVFSVPIVSDNKIIGGVFASYSIESLQEILSVSSFDGEGYTYIVKKDGSKVVDSANPTSFQNMTNIFESMEQADERNGQSVEELKALLENGDKGYVIFYNKIGKYMYCTPLGINDWSLIEVVPVDVMETTTNYIMARTYIICMILIAVYTLIVITVFREEYKKKKQMRTLLYVDELTGGHTFAKFKEEIEKQMKNAEDIKKAFIEMDIDDFKLVNELFGYEEGDKLLRYLWRVLSDSCKGGEIVARRLADRFTLFLNYQEKEEIEKRVISMMEKIRQCRIGRETEYMLQPVFGIYYVEKSGENAEDMLTYATLAHNLAKKERDCFYVIYNDEIRGNMLQKKQLSDQMEHAYRHHHFVVYYQPKYEAETKKLAGAEALIRWRKSDGTMVSPGQFIPLAEETGFICKLDKYVFHEVCLAQKRFIEKGLKVVPISVNLSRRHLDNPEFINEYKAILDETQIPIECIQLEITESAMFEKQDQFISIIKRLHELGFVILMDDFGTGYSSLMMLKQIPIDVMKLDKTFVDDYNDIRGEQIIRCVMQMAQKLEIEITAEGVETEEQYVFLRGIGCDTIQGYYFAKPMPEEEYKKRMEQQ